MCQRNLHSGVAQWQRGSLSFGSARVKTLDENRANSGNPFSAKVLEGNPELSLSTKVDIKCVETIYPTPFRG